MFAVPGQIYAQQMLKFRQRSGETRWSKASTKSEGKRFAHGFHVYLCMLM